MWPLYFVNTKNQSTFWSFDCYSSCNYVQTAAIFPVVVNCNSHEFLCKIPRSLWGDHSPYRTELRFLQSTIKWNISIYYLLLNAALLTTVFSPELQFINQVHNCVSKTNLLISLSVFCSHLFILRSIRASFPSLAKLFGYVTNGVVGVLGFHFWSFIIAETEECRPTTQPHSNHQYWQQRPIHVTHTITISCC